MEKGSKQGLRRFVEKIYGGLNMSWPAVILFAVATAILSAVFLLVPIFRRTSFARMGETFEAWIFFAVIIMANCKKPLESALKTFVFFVVSQPLIYLIQVPFSEMGWGLFGYYRFWIVWTLLTFPMAYVGWYIFHATGSIVLAFIGSMALVGLGGVVLQRTVYSPILAKPRTSCSGMPADTPGSSQTYTTRAPVQPE